MLCTTYVRRSDSPQPIPHAACEAFGGVFDIREGCLLLLSELPFDRLDERFRLWRHTEPETPYDGTVSCDKKLFEVPLNRSGKLGIGALRGQVLVQITLVPAVDVYFLEHGEGHAITRAAESGNL